MNKKNIKINIKKFILFLVISSFFALGSITKAIKNYSENNNDNNIEKRIEKRNFKEEISKWNSIFLNWENQRMKNKEDEFGYKDEVLFSVCENSFCWEERDEYFTIKRNDKVINLGKNGEADIVFFDNGDKWKYTNNGKNIKWESTHNGSWESENFGENLTYKNIRGELWKLYNFGRNLISESFNKK